MPTIKSKLTSREVAKKVVSFVKMFYTSNQMDIHIGLTEDGEVDYHHDVLRSTSGIVVTLYETKGGWSLGVFDDGDYENEDDWTAEYEAALADNFEEWNQDEFSLSEHDIELAG